MLGGDCPVIAVREPRTNRLTAEFDQWKPNPPNLSHKRAGLVGECAYRRFSLIAPTFVSSHIAAASVLFVGTRLTALIGFQQLALPVGAAKPWTQMSRSRSSQAWTDSETHL
jgi:hypothetical protein